MLELEVAVPCRNTRQAVRYVRCTPATLLPILWVHTAFNLKQTHSTYVLRKTSLCCFTMIMREYMGVSIPSLLGMVYSGSCEHDAEPAIHQGHVNDINSLQRACTLNSRHPTPRPQNAGVPCFKVDCIPGTT